MSCFGRAPDCLREPGGVTASQRSPHRHPRAVGAPCVGDDRRLLLQRNISAAPQVSRKPPSSAARVMRVSAPGTHTVHNYSVQTLNSVELAKKELYREMAKVSNSAGPRAAQRAHCGQGGAAGDPVAGSQRGSWCRGSGCVPTKCGPSTYSGSWAQCLPGRAWL